MILRSVGLASRKQNEAKKKKSSEDPPKPQRLDILHLGVGCRKFIYLCKKYRNRVQQTWGAHPAQVRHLGPGREKPGENQAKSPQR